MKITVSDNVLKVANNFDKQIKEQPLLVKKALSATAEFLIFLIKQKTKKGIDVDGIPFVSYTPEYKEFRQDKGFGTKPDLYFSGNMISNIVHKATSSSANIFFASKFENTKALQNQSKRKFFAIGGRDVNSILDVFKKEFNKGSKI